MPHSVPMNDTYMIKFKKFSTSTTNVFRAQYLDCEVEVAEDCQSLQVIDADGEAETWAYNGNFWYFAEGTNGQTPTRYWTDADCEALEAAIEAIR